MNKLLQGLIAIIVLSIGAGCVILADKYGLFQNESNAKPITSEATSIACPHGLTSSTCAFCDESLIEKLGFCNGHSIPEAFCTKCNHKLIEVFKNKNDWCKEHDIPESQCTICNPDKVAEKIPLSEPTPKPSLINISVKENILRKDSSPSLVCSTESLKIQFTSPQTIKKVGLEFKEIKEQNTSKTFSCNALITYNKNQLAHLSPRTSGIISKINKDLGDKIKKGDVLAMIDSTELGKAKSEYFQAKAFVKLWKSNYDREKNLLKKHASTEKEVLQNKTNLTKSRISLSRSIQNLKTLGLSLKEIEQASRNQNNSTLLPLTSPLDGFIVKRDAVIGELVDQKIPIFAVSDTSKMWAILDIYEKDIQRTQLGMTVTIDVKSLPGRKYTGKITWISTKIDPKTKTLKARVEVLNKEGLLKSGSFATAIISLKNKSPSLLVPSESIQWEGCCNVVFVKVSDYVLEPRKISIDHQLKNQTAIKGNIKAGEIVATSGSFLLKTEILKGSIGAGCCEVELGK